MTDANTTQWPVSSESTTAPRVRVPGVAVGAIDNITNRIWTGQAWVPNTAEVQRKLRGGVVTLSAAVMTPNASD